MLELLRTGRPLAVAALALAVMAQAPQAAAATPEAENQAYCANSAGIYSADFSVEACSFLIVSGNRAPKDLAVLFSYRCKGYLDDGKLDRALQDCSEAIWLDGNLQPAYHVRALVHERLGRHQRAVTDFTQAITQQPSSASAWEGLCRNELALGHVQRSVSACSESLQLRPEDAPTHATRGLAYLISGAFDAAIGDFDAALRADPALPVALYGRGIARLSLHDSKNGAADIAAAEWLKGDIGKQFADRQHIKADGDARTPAKPGF